ncbi:MAG: 16S rRNA (uracil(1498)-N(3))-methyltransferase [Prolixibacteraceae bacterium]|nr:16S rRNA (uracil(1498)-N(3))-methyltransferase [Prolixibacteraceae bacterium]
MNIFYTPDISGSSYTLDETESKHCIRVLRFSKGDKLILVDGIGNKFEARIFDPNPKKCSVEIISKTTEFEKRIYFLHVAIAPTKNIDRFEWFVEKATEIGIDEITPLLCEHSERKQINIERIEKVIVSAMKQSLKAYKPVLNNLTNFGAFCRMENQGLKFVAHCDEGNKHHLFDLVKPSERVTILIGPEGDFSAAEIEAAVNFGFKEVSLGNSRLRTETAGIVACDITGIINR